MLNTSVNQFRTNLKKFIEDVIKNHQPLRVTRRSGADFVVIGADDWERQQETIYVLQNQSLMQQITDSLETHNKKEGYIPTAEELDEIISL